LVVTDNLGRSLTRALSVTLDRYDAVIQSPNQLVGRGTMEIKGAAATSPEVPFESFVLEWGAGSAPATFSSTGIALVGGGTSPVANGKLATWDTAGLVHGQYYTLRLRVRTASGAETMTSVRVQADKDLATGWPIPIAQDSRKLVAPAVGDLDGDGQKEVVTAGPDDKIRVYGKDGQPLPGFPLTLKEGDAYEWGVNLEDIDGNGTLEIIAVARNAGIVPRTRIVVVGHNGIPEPAWPGPGIALGSDSSDLTPALADLDGNGIKELVAIEATTWVSRTDVTIHAYALGGVELPGFPRTHVLPPIGFDAGQMFPSMHGVPSISDVDRDGFPEIAWSYSDRVFLFDRQGNVRPGWPFVAPLYNGKIMVFENAAASGDIDGDGRLELFSAARGQNCGACETQLYAWKDDGSVLNGWPKNDQLDGIKLSNTLTSQNTPVLVDLDGDDKDEVLTGLGRIFAFDDAGPVGFPFTPIASQTQPSFADLDGDGRLEFSGNDSNGISIMKDDGSMYWQRSMPAGGARNTLGVLADLDSDGRIELVVAHADSSDNIGLFVWTIPGAGGDVEWPMFSGHSARSGRWTVGGGVEPPPVDQVAPVCSVDSPRANAIVSGSMTVQVGASDNWGVTVVRLYRDGTLIGLDDSAPFSFAWDTRGVANGQSLLRAEATDAAGNLGTSSTVAVTVSNGLAAPSNLAATSAGLSVTLTWKDNAANETGFRIERGVKAKGLLTYKEIVAVGASSGSSSASYTDKVSAEGTYYYRVRAYGAGTFSGFSNEAAIRVSRTASK
jgi:hypothetical protein